MQDKQVGASERGPEQIDEGWWASVFAQDGGRSLAPDEPALRLQTDPDDDWAQALHLHESDEPIELTVTGFNRGGLLVNLNSLRGFVPASHLLDLPNHLSEEDRREALSARIGQTLRLKVIEYDRAKGRVVLSERAALAGAGARDVVLDRLRPGELISGTVTNLTDFGVFIDLGGIEGLVHISEVSWSRVAHPSDVLQIGQTVQVHVLSIDRAHGRIALSLKRTRPDPWRTVAERYTIGQIISGTVTNVVTFGAFVSVEDGLEGLIHVSELAEGHFLHPRNVVSEGETIQARILHIDPAARRLSLSLRQAL
jgi:small subunit ribosomal protein S1